MGSLSGSLYMMGLSSLFLRTILFSCVALGCFNPVVVVGKERSAAEVQEGNEENRAGSENGTYTADNDTSENGMDESEDSSTADDYNETVLVLGDNATTVDFMETENRN